MKKSVEVKHDVLQNIMIEFVPKNSIVQEIPTGEAAPYILGKAYLLRTVTNYYIGTLVAVHPQELDLRDAAWIADTGRFHTAVAKGILNEIEPYADGDVLIGRGAITDASIWNHEVPRVQK